MPEGTLREAMEDARGVIAEFTMRNTREDDCVPAVREAIAELDRVLARALEHETKAGGITRSDRDEVDRAARSLLLLWSKCGEQSKALMLDIKTVFGRYVTLSGP